jgi:O-antigen/teichoic acid export membrane protein
MGTTAVKTQTEHRASIATLPQTSVPAIPHWKLWGIRLPFSLVDPGTTVSAGLLVNLLLARWLPAQQYGGFALAFALFLFLAGIHNVLVLEPMSVLGPANFQRSLADYFEAQIWVHLAFTTVLAAPLLLAVAFLTSFGYGGPLPGALLGGGLALPFVQLLWLARRMCHILQRPAIAMAGSMCNLVLLLAGLFALQARHKLAPLPVFLLLGFASLCAALLIFHKLQIGLDDTRPCSVSWLSAAAENWCYGRLLLGGALGFALLSQTGMLLTPIFLGLAATGKLFAMQIPALLMLQCSAAAAMLLLPSFARESLTGGSSKRLRQLAHRASLSLAGAPLLLAVLLYFTAAPVERILFGGKFANDVWLIPLFMLIPLSVGLASGYSMALRAMRRPHFDLLATRIAAAVSVQTAFLFIPLWGLAGAAISMASGFAAHSAVVCLCFRQATANDRKEFASQSAEEITPLEQFNT